MSKNKLKRNIPPALLRPKAPKLKLPLPPKVEVKKPKVSVILSSYNHAAYVAAAIESVLNQTFTDFELLIFDDGSTDNSREIIKSFDDPRIKTFLYEKNLGPRIASSEAFNAAQGKYIAVHHSDDLWREDKLQKQVEFLDAHEEYAACFTWVNFIDENGNIQELPDGDFYKNRFDQPNRTRAEWLNYFFYNSNCLCHPSVMIRREAYRKYDLLKTNGLWQLPDYAMWIKLAFNAPFYILNERLTLFRLRIRQLDNMSAATFDKRVRVESEMYFVLADFSKNFNDDKFFLEVFPDAKKFIVDGKINRDFAFAKICLENSHTDFSSTFKFFALNLLKKILSDDKAAAQVKALYNYDEKSFLFDTGKYDVFNLVQKLSMLEGTLYFDTGNNFNADEVIRKFIFVDVKGKFYARYNFTSDKPVKNLRFDPGNDIISLRIDGVKINGVEQENFVTSSAKFDGKFYDFLTDDPQIIFSTENLTGAITFEFLGEIAKNYGIKLVSAVQEDDKKISELNAELVKLHQWGKDLEKLNAEVGSVNVELNAQIQSLNADKDNLNSQVENLNSQIESLGSQNQNLGTQIKSLNEQVAALNSHNQNLNSQNERLEAQLKASNGHIDAVTAENRRLNDILNEVFNSNSWKVTEPLRTLGRWLRSGSKDKAISIARPFYRAIPLNDETKTKFKDKFYKNFAPILKNTKHYQIWLEAQNLKEFRKAQRIISIYNERNKFPEPLEEQPGKIAIQTHIFYLDLAEEIANYFSNMPYKFDALISIVEPTAETQIKSTFEKIPNIENLIIRVVPNRGRDVAPFVCGFGDILLNYDFIAHIHSKKSLYTGQEQIKWRHYLFDSLLGSTDRIKKIFAVFVKYEHIGLIYPKPSENVPYAAFTWLSNKHMGTYLLNKINVPASKTDYFDFPAGTMFWARAGCLKKLFDNLSIEDFPEELGQNDGTIAHVFERVITLTVNAEYKDFLEFDPETENYAVNIGSKNMWQYYGRNPVEMQEILARGEIVSFDVFDTLVMRKVAAPYLINELIQLKLKDLPIKKFDFPKLRLKAEEIARQQKKADVTLDDIYESFSALTKFDKMTCKQIRELEVETELEFIVPRPEVVTIFNALTAQGKKIWLISDMYLQTADLEKILQKCGISGYEKIMLSCETGMRKDTAEIWNYLVQKNLTGGKLVHSGDNETSDLQLPSDRGFAVYHIMSAINLFSQMPFGIMFLNSLDYKMSLYAGMFFGTLLAEKFHDPFQLHDSPGGKHFIGKFRDLGYWLYGPPILTFMLWLIKRTLQDDTEQILFLARDGYFLQPLYKFITKLLNVEEIPNNYFYASRRAVTVASIREISQAKELVKLRFVGTQKKFFNARFGLDIGTDEEIILPKTFSTNDYEVIVEKIIDEHAEEILQRASEERANFEKYIAKIGRTFDKVGVVDMGYSGTIQFYLQKILQRNLTGYYFATSSTNRFGATATERMRGCFTENDDYGKTASAVYKYQLLFEAILTAPDAQLKYFDADGKPVFGEPEPAQFQIEDIREVHEGIKDFCRDVITNFGKYILRTDIDFKFIDVWVRSFVHDENIVAPELKKIFAFDDKYCNTFTGNALDLYLGGGV